ncbi:MAG: FMN-binding protein [Ignavibacteriaceae bacterium]|nr:FMN-binding protein [Ignavibacteriaceae bacterium]
MKILLIVIFASVLILPQEIKERVEEVISNEFGSGIKYESEKYGIPSDVKTRVEKSAKQKFYSDNVYLYKIKSGKTLKAYGFLDNVYGKSLPITFMVFLDTKGSVLSAHIIKYREQYGGQVGSQGWLDQFKGRNNQSGYEVSKDIDSISGATISVNSVTTGIKKITLLYQEIKDKIK